MSRLKYFSTETNQWEYADNVTGNNIDLTNYATKEYVENSKVAIDTTLKIEGQAADAKAVGEAISKLSGGNSIYYTDIEVEYPVGEGIHYYACTKTMLSNNGDGIKVGDIIVASNGTLCKVTTDSGDTVSYDLIGTISEDGKKADKTGLRLGVHTDGLVYLFVDNAPVGTGIDISAGGVSGYVDSENNIILNNLPNGTYTIKYEMEDGNYIDIGNLELDNNVYYSVTNTLTNCTNSNGATEVVEGESYSATITATSGYELKSMTVTMGASPVTVSGGNISIANVTGDIVITAVAEEIQTGTVYTNLLPLSVDASGSPYNGGKGYKSGYRISGSTGSEISASGACVSGFIPITNGTDVVRIKNIKLSNSASINNIVFYEADKTRRSGLAGTEGAFTSGVNAKDDIYSFAYSYWSDDETPAFFRFSCGEITDDTIVTINEEIVDTPVVAPSYTNLADPASADWLENHRINSSGNTVSNDGTYVTNYIPCKLDDDVRIKGLTLTGNIRMYDSSKAGVTNTSCSTLTSEGLASLSGDVVTLKAGYETANYKKSETAYMRFCGTLTDGYTANDVIITVNEPIV